MKRSAILLLAALALTACGGGSGAPEAVTAAAVVTDPNAVTSVTVNADYRQGDTSGEYLVDVTFRTADGREFHVEYCDTPIRQGDHVTLQEYGVGTTLIYVNDVLVGDIIDWEATERDIAGR